jgi:hypothetical protein
MDKKLKADEILKHIFSTERNLAEFLKPFLEFFEIHEKAKLERRLEESRRFVKIALQDFEASKILYRAKMYPMAIYHMQQAVEKYVKALALTYFGLNEKEIKRYISHDSPKAFIRLLKRYEKFLGSFFRIAEMFSISFPEISGKNLLRLERIINKKKREIAKMSSEEVKNLVEIPTKIKRIVESDKTKNEIAEYLLEIQRKVQEIETHQQISRKLVNTIEKISNEQEKVLKQTWIFPGLYILSIITYPHATFARYPNKVLQPEEYNENLGIIQSFNEIVRLMSDIVNSFDI